MSARTLPEKYDVLFPAYTSAGNYLGRFWNIGISARTLQEKCSVLFPICTNTGKCLGRFWNIGMSARTLQENVPVHSVLKWRHYFVQHAYYMKTAPEAGRSCTFLFGSLTSP